LGYANTTGLLEQLKEIDIMLDAYIRRIKGEAERKKTRS